jgi:probable 2-oxoglutarate dehydrogenase E1 component DHKTD1
MSNTLDPNYLGNRSLTHKWAGMVFSHVGKNDDSTGYDIDNLTKIGQASVEVPETFNAHQRLVRTHIEARLKSIKKDSIDWATAEAMAFGSLNQEGYNVRFSGEDVERGTFSHRHMKIIDQVDESVHCPLKHSKYMQETSKGRISINNSNLAECGPMGFEVGYSMESPNNMVLWEA